MSKPTADSRQPTVPSPTRSGLWAVGCGLAVLWATACTEITTPLRAGFYGYSLIASDVVAQDTIIDGQSYIAGDTITDTLDFAWPASHTVKIWVQDTVGLPGHLQAAVAAWRNVLQYGELTATFVSDSSHADIIVRGSAPPPAPVAGAMRLDASMEIPPPAACEGVTDVFVSTPDHTKLWTPIQMHVIPKYALADPLTVPCLARVSIHELGHALGLFKHSPDTLDIMHTFPYTSVTAPSDGDATTILTLYHQRSDLRPAPATDTLPATASRP